jgi:hypothetical protein
MGFTRDYLTVAAPMHPNVHLEHGGADLHDGKRAT